MDGLERLKKKAFQNEDVKKEYEALEEEFSLLDILITMRKKAQLTQEEIAIKLGTKKSNISRLEHLGSNPSWKTLQNYAHACGFELFVKFK
jgi:DNA-binding XRE family transcriptional regulator